MPEKHSFEYAIIRVVPRVDREEFLNIGVILYSQSLRYLESAYILDKERLSIFSPHLDIPELEEHLRAFELIAHGSPGGGPIARLDTASRFRWLTATRSTILQTSKVHPGLCTDPKTMLERLLQQLVLN